MKNEITFKAIILGILLSMLMSGAMAYLGLFAGMTISASIPAAVISMGVLALFKQSNILENNLVQTAASAGESLAAGVIFTIPALVLLGYWQEFNYLEVAKIATVGGIIGVIFTIPLRRAFILVAKLQYPEGIATSEVLQAGEQARTGTDDEAASGLKIIIISGLAGGLMKLAEQGFSMWNIVLEGATNVGKSMLINAMTGENRAIVSSIAGTTRDSLDSSIVYQNQKIQLIDTAGIRRRGKIDRGIEKYSVLRSMKAIDRCETAALVIDASEHSTGQDTHIASYILDAGKSIVIVVNKWDLSREVGLTKNEMESEIRKRYKFAPYAPICFTSALRSNGINILLDTAIDAKKEWCKEIPRAEIRKTVMTAVSEHIPPTHGRKELKIYSALQDSIMPPSFTFFVNHSDMVHFSYKRYLENQLRDSYGFMGSPIRMRFQGWKK